LLYNAALKFYPLLNVPLLPLDVGKAFARLIAHAPKRGTPLRPRLGVNRAKRAANTHGIARVTMSFEDDLRRVEEHVAEARRAPAERADNPVAGGGRQHMGRPEDTLAAGIQSTPIRGTQGPPQSELHCSSMEDDTRQAVAVFRHAYGITGAARSQPPSTRLIAVA
jgi:hypothetical protein